MVGGVWFGRVSVVRDDGWGLKCWFGIFCRVIEISMECQHSDFWWAWLWVFFWMVGVAIMRFGKDH